MEMEHPRWNDPIRRKTEALLGGRLSEEDWLYVLEEGYLEDDIDQRPLSDQPSVLAQEIRRLRSVGDLPRPRRARTGNFIQRQVRDWLTADESTFAAAISEAMYRRALAYPGVQEAQRDFQERAISHGIRPSASSAAGIREAWAAGDLGFGPEFVRFVREISDYYGWDADEAAVFLIADLTPSVEPLRAYVRVREFRDEHGADTPRSRARIVLELDPWLSSETVAGIYEELRQELIGKGRKRPEFPELEAFRFVVARLKDDGTPLESWSAIGREWNEKHQDWNQAHPESAWKYSKPENIKRAYEGVRKRIINPEYRIAGSEPSGAPAPGGDERGAVLHVYVDTRERGPMESPRARRNQGD